VIFSVFVETSDTKSATPDSSDAIQSAISFNVSSASGAPAIIPSIAASIFTSTLSSTSSILPKSKDFNASSSPLILSLSELSSCVL